MVYTVYIKILVGENMSHSKDATQKVLLACKDIFADVINGFIFSGDEKVKAEDLEPFETPVSIYICFRK